MVTQLRSARLRLRPAVGLGIPLFIWTMLWFSIQPGTIGDIFAPDTPKQFLQGLRATFPYVAAILAVLWMAQRFSERSSGNLFFSSPLALTALYGLVGVFTAFRSPDVSVSLNWIALYLTVPLVLWAGIWGPDPLGQIQRIIRLNWLLVFLAVTVFFVIALFNLGLGEAILKPSALLRCESGGNWYVVSSGIIRSTGVGRFAAVTAIIAMGMLWSGSLRWPWVLVILASSALLLNTGARASIVGFAAAVPVVFLLLQGKRAVVGGVLVLAVLVPLVWATGAHNTFLRNCIFVGTDTAGIEYLKMRSPIIAEPATAPPGQSTVEDALPTSDQPLIGETPSSTAQPPVDDTPQAPTESAIPEGFFTLTGRTRIWAAGWQFIKLSPTFGYGFHGDRLVLGTHMHNSVLHAMIQTGVVGTIPFVGALVFAWLLLLRTIRDLNRLTNAHKTLVIQTAGILVFLSVRSLPESTGAFFGVDWLILSPILLYLRLINSTGKSEVEDP